MDDLNVAAKPKVVPHAGTWIEIAADLSGLQDAGVVPHAGTWIEILVHMTASDAHSMSFPTRERGLKFVKQCTHLSYLHVVPHAGTWIEIYADQSK